MRVIDPGHIYSLDVLDGSDSSNQVLTFVKRTYRSGKAENVFPGTNCQEVLRALENRVGYLHAEKPHWLNPIIKLLLRLSIWLFEYRAASRRGQSYYHTPAFATYSYTCDGCGHTDCRLKEEKI